ncbi:Plant cysteine oxidase 2 [Striga hermonthica]|uniref:cysteine dioxygenase n=1 Tax=Striga hermonthica TaxID=68872 RepID=A0A9N7NDC0_STRHE|nr:Plant cysteine oxidase 2 [Striga hermonthica]
MGIEQNRSSGKNKVSSESRKNKRRQRKSSQVQRLYETCREVFDDCGPGIVPAPEKVEKLAAVLDEMTQADLGIRPDMPFFSSKRAPIITYLQLHECEQFSIGIFCLPPKSVIPLHNHPGMTVFSKLLFGTMHIKSCDWSSEFDITNDSPATATLPKSHPNNELRLAKIKVDSDFTAPCKTSILYPAEGGNMHRFTAKSACAVLDVIGPPYCDPEGRHCQYYSEFPFASLSGDNEKKKEGYALLKEREKPEDHIVVGAPYNGPKIAKK